MFQWIKSRFNRDRDDVYSPGERFIYKYFDGEKNVRADPVVLYKKVMENWPELSAAMKLARSRSKDAAKGYADMMKGMRAIFSVKDLDGGGLTELEVSDLFDHFMSFATGLKKNTSTTPIPTETESGTSSEDAPPTGSTLDSGSTGSGPITEPPGPSPTA